jgi:hypothetical protein
MVKLIIGFIFAACAIASAGSDIPLSLKDTISFPYDSAVWIAAPQKIPDAYKSGELLVDIPTHEGIVTLRDTTFRLLPGLKKGTDVIVNLRAMLKRHFDEAGANGKLNNSIIGPENYPLIKKVGINWRLIKK